MQTPPNYSTVFLTPEGSVADAAQAALSSMEQLVANNSPYWALQVLAGQAVLFNCLLEATYTKYAKHQPDWAPPKDLVAKVLPLAMGSALARLVAQREEGASPWQ